MTRYPKAGKGSKWTIKELDATKLDWKGDTLSDSDGLFGEVRVSNESQVTISFRYGFKWQAKKVWHYCGTYPNSDMAAIRGERDKARNLVKSGIDPRAHKIAEKIEAQAKVEATILADQQKRDEDKTFLDLYEAWIKNGVSRSDDNQYLKTSFGNHAIPTLGHIKVRLLSEDNLRELYRDIIKSGKVRTAEELSKDIGQMIRWAEKRKPWRALLVEGNPSELVEINDLLPDTYTKVRTRQLSEKEIYTLKKIFDQDESEYEKSEDKQTIKRILKRQSQIAIWLSLGTLCRIGELLMTEWEHVNLEERTWFIPAKNTKGRKNKKRDQRVYLSDFTLDQFKKLHHLTGESKWAFPGQFTDDHVCVKTVSKQVGDRQVMFKHRTKKLKFRAENNSLVLGTEEWRVHDLRRTGATLMQKIKIHRDIINLCQNHIIGTQVDKSYLLDEYADEKKEAWYKLGDKIEEILNKEYND